MGRYIYGRKRNELSEDLWAEGRGHVWIRIYEDAEAGRGWTGSREPRATMVTVTFPPHYVTMDTLRRFACAPISQPISLTLIFLMCLLCLFILFNDSLIHLFIISIIIIQTFTKNFFFFFNKL